MSIPLIPPGIDVSIAISAFIVCHSFLNVSASVAVEAVYAQSVSLVVAHALPWPVVPVVPVASVEPGALAQHLPVVLELRVEVRFRLGFRHS
jgi:hypothetical protein